MSRRSSADASLARVSDLPECLDCGACCFSQLEQYVSVSGRDYERLAERATELVVFDGYRSHLRMFAGHCAALRVEPASSQFVCGAYELRPETCRELERGSAQCRAEREAKADRPPAALRLAREML